jgi:hypothetical protein
MTGSRLITTVAAIAALGATPALALASSSNSNANRPAVVPPATTPVQTGNPHTSTPGPHATLPAKAKAYGVFCNKESKKHVAGQKGTPFSQCVTALAKLATSVTSNPAKACATESKKHVAGQKGTPFSQCVSAAAKLKAAKSVA